MTPTRGSVLPFPSNFLVDNAVSNNMTTKVEISDCITNCLCH